MAIHEIAYLALGSNMGAKDLYMRQAVDSIGKIPEVRLSGVSNFYNTRPLGDQNQATYLNAVVKIETKLSPRQLHEACLAIETSLGRIRNKRWEARTIDIDLLLYGTMTYQDERLTIPHPGINERDFVLIPLKDVASEAIAFNGKTLGEWLSELKERFVIDRFCFQKETEPDFV